MRGGPSRIDSTSQDTLLPWLGNTEYAPGFHRMVTNMSAVTSFDRLVDAKLRKLRDALAACVLYTRRGLCRSIANSIIR